MKTSYKIILAACLAASLAGTLTGCKQMPLEQEIAVKEAGSWDFIVKDGPRGTEYIRIYDAPNKLGFFKFEYGQKHPCNQGFQKVIKTVAPGLVAYTSDADAKSFACNSRIRYIFRTDANGHPYEGWEVARINDREKREFFDVSETVRYWDDLNIKPKYFIVK